MIHPMPIDLDDPIALMLVAAAALEQSGAECAAYGGLALGMYLEPRETRDADFAVTSVDIVTMPQGGSLMKRAVTVVLLGLCLATYPYAFAQTPPPPAPRPPDASRGLETKYVRDSAEYATLCREVYRVATYAVTGAAHTGTWGVVLDLDETTLDNSAYQLERGAYGLPFDDASWSAWIMRKEAGIVPGVEGFVNAVRSAGGKVVYITDRNTEYVAPGGQTTDLVTPTRENLERNRLWNKADLLCLKTSSSDTKAMRRKAVATGAGVCSWSGVRVSVVAFVGDQMGDFPAAGETFTGAGADDQFGRSFFLLPDPMYGKWTNGVTRLSGSFP